LLDRIEITGAVITATRCMPSAPTPLTWPAAALTVKRNQPGLFA